MTQAHPMAPVSLVATRARRAPALTLLLTGLLPLSAAGTELSALKQRVMELEQELARAQADLQAAQRTAADQPAVGGALAPAAALDATALGQGVAPVSEPLIAPRTEPSPVAAAPEPAPPPDDKIRIGPLAIGGAMRVNYILGDYPGRGDGPSRGGHGGNFELDTFRINVDLQHEQLVGALEYRWYDGYNFLHTGWLGWDFADGSQVQVGVNRVPFGPGPFGISQSWFFDQHYYLGLADDMQLGVKYSTELGDLALDLAYYNRSVWDGRGRSRDSARYSYAPVIWTSGLDADGNVVAAAPNGYQRRHQFNLRAIQSFSDGPVVTALGASVQYGQLEGRRARDGDHWAASLHMTNSWNNWLLATQVTRFAHRIHADNALGTATLLPMGAYDFAWPVAAKGWLPAVSLSYLWETTAVPWLDSVRPYLEYSTILKDEGDFNDSALFIAGAAWARGNWFVYTDLAWSNGNYFVGDRGDDYSNIFAGVGDFGVNGNDRWNYRFNINFGYYF